MTRSWSNFIIAIVLIVAAVSAAAYFGDRAGRRDVERVTAVSDERGARIMDWVVKRNPRATIVEFKHFPAILIDESAAAGIDYLIVMAIIDKESEFNPSAVGASGEIGLMQVKPATAEVVAKDLAITYEPPVRLRGKSGYESLGSLGVPAVNVRIGVSYLRQQVARFGMTPAALRAYNRGPTRAHVVWPHDRYPDGIGLRLVTLLAAFPR